MRLKVPASTTNFGAGFDTFGLALNLYNVFEVHKSSHFSVQIEGEGGHLPTDENNLVIKVYKRCCEVYGEKPSPFSLRQINHVPTARGLGSSATAIVGGVYIFERLHRKSLSLKEKLKIAFEFENHPDNLLPTMLGGFVVCVSGDPVTYSRLTFPEDLSLSFVVPDFELSTQEARRVLRQEVPLEDAVFNLQRASLFVSALIGRKYELLRTAVEDRLHQPYRAKLIRGIEDVFREGYRAGAYAVFLSGAGPTVCALCSPEQEVEVGNSMKQAFSQAGVKARVLNLRGSNEGATWLNTPSQDS